MAEPFFWVRCVLIEIELVIAIEGHTGTAGVDQLRNLVLNTGFYNVPCADCVDAVEVFPRPPDP